jgi:hypothetical protein
MKMTGKFPKMYFFSFLLFMPVLIACDPFDLHKSHPSDDELIRNFYKNEADFNKLISMSNQDPKVIRIARDFTRLENNWQWPRPESELGFSKQRWDEYRSLFDKLGLDAGISRETDSKGTVIFLTASAKGMTFRGTSKGYAYSEKELSPVFDSVDQNPLAPQNRPKHGVAYKKIKDHWFLSYDW